MKRLILILFLLVSFGIINSRETVGSLFLDRMKLTPELIKERKGKSKVNESYNFVKYQIKDKPLFDKIVDISLNSLDNKILNKGLNSVSKLKPSISIIKKGGIIYLLFSYSTNPQFNQPIFPMQQVAGLLYYRGWTYQLIFFDSDTTLFTPTKEMKKIIYKKYPTEPTPRYSAYQIYLQIKGNNVEEINWDTVIK